MAAALATHVAGTVTGAFASAAERRGAYDLLANVAVTIADIASAAWAACVRRSADAEFVYVPIDGSSLALRDPYGTRGTGAVGSRTAGARGFIVMTAIAISSAGVALGLCAQQFWARVGKPTKHQRHARDFAQKETRYWVLLAQQTLDNFRLGNAMVRVWFQFDRGGDVGDVLWEAVEKHWLITIRAAQNRRLEHAAGQLHLWPMLLRQKVLGRYYLDVPGGEQRRARTARMVVRACTVTLRMRDRYKGKPTRLVTIGAVLTRESGTTPRGEKPIEWLLLTTHEIASFADARQVIVGYAQRWKIELFHRLWKSGRCSVEHTHLHDVQRILKWATILASVAVRALHLTEQARATPDVAADELLSRDEIDAVILLRKPKGYQRGDTPTLGDAVRWIADIGGYMGRGKAHPPGMIVVGRGLDRIAGAADVLQSLRTPSESRRRNK